MIPLIVPITYSDLNKPGMPLIVLLLETVIKQPKIFAITQKINNMNPSVLNKKVRDFINNDNLSEDYIYYIIFGCTLMYENDTFPEFIHSVLVALGINNVSINDLKINSKNLIHQLINQRNGITGGAPFKEVWQILMSIFIIIGVLYADIAFFHPLYIKATNVYNTTLTLYDTYQNIDMEKCKEEVDVPETIIFLDKYKDIFFKDWDWGRAIGPYHTYKVMSCIMYPNIQSKMAFELSEEDAFMDLNKFTNDPVVPVLLKLIEYKPDDAKSLVVYDSKSLVAYDSKRSLADGLSKIVVPVGDKLVRLVDEKTITYFTNFVGSEKFNAIKTDFLKNIPDFSTIDNIDDLLRTLDEYYYKYYDKNGNQIKEFKIGKTKSNVDYQPNTDAKPEPSSWGDAFLDGSKLLFNKFLECINGNPDIVMLDLLNILYYDFHIKMINIRRDIKIKIANSEANIQTFIIRASKEFSQIKTAIEYLWIIFILNCIMGFAVMSLVAMLPLPVPLKRLIQRETIEGPTENLSIEAIEGPTNNTNQIVTTTKRNSTRSSNKDKGPYGLMDIDGGYRNRTKRYRKQKQIRKKIQSKRNIRKLKK